MSISALPLRSSRWSWDIGRRHMYHRHICCAKKMLAASPTVLAASPTRLTARLAVQVGIKRDGVVVLVVARAEEERHAAAACGADERGDRRFLRVELLSVA